METLRMTIAETPTQTAQTQAAHAKRRLDTGELVICGVRYMPVDMVPANRPALTERVAKWFAEKMPGRGNYVVIVAREAATREQLEDMIVELRGALSAEGDDENGWQHSETADTFEASRVLVPDRAEERE